MSICILFRNIEQQNKSFTHEKFHFDISSELSDFFWLIDFDLHEGLDISYEHIAKPNSKSSTILHFPKKFANPYVRRDNQNSQKGIVNPIQSNRHLALSQQTKTSFLLEYVDRES